MISFTDVAKDRVLRFIEAQRSQGVTALRIAGTRAEQRLWLVKPEDKRPDDEVQSENGFDVYLDKLSAKQLDGATVDFVEGVMQSGFRLFFVGATWDDPVAQKVQDVIDRQINPGVASHGGAVALEGVKEGVAYIRFGGGCHGCGAADLTLKGGIERILREQVPEIVGVQDVTDHSTGENPYYAREQGANSSPLA
ncbi:MAG: iron-sulfur cluster assembly accessory protein [Deinococcales bacterium]|mgnify:FL=1|nr:iron-sulfur cluster assembly accessory protein [Deinococcales bacterium]